MRRAKTRSKPALRKAPAPVTAGSRFAPWVMGVLLVLVTIIVYWPATRCDFVSYDDDVYVTANAHVQDGLTWESIKWACVNSVAVNWHPLTVWSHMLDCQLFGLKPWGHHLTSVLFHALNAGLVFALLQLMTGAVWRSLLVAALFAVHPLRVESVAWVAERKDVLSAFFGLLALIAYVRWANGNRREPDGRGSWSVWYLLSLFLLALGLMSKPMLVTWPFVMLLLDYWPLRRMELPTPNAQRSTILRLVREKIPFFVLAALGSVLTFVVQQHGGAIKAVENLSVGGRCANALVSYSRYLGKLIWPTDLAVFYPLPAHWPIGKVVLAGGLTVGLSGLVWAQRRGRPYLLVGWLWYLGTLVPVIGLVQAGGQAMADRYTYLPSLGVLVVAVWGGCELTRRWRYQVLALSLAGGAAVVLCLALTQRQLGYWQNTELLFRHALDVTENNVLAHKNLGDALYQQGHIAEAIGQFQAAIRLNPEDAMSHYNLGTAFYQQGRNVEAIGQFQEAIRLDPEDAMSHYNLGVALYQQGRLDEAISQYREALRIKPDHADAHNNLGVALCKKGHTDEAIKQVQEAIRLKPDFAQAHYNLGTAFCQQRRIAEGIAQFQEAIRLKPDDARTHYSLGLALYQQGRTAEAVGQFQEALRLQPDYAEARKTLEDALARRGGSLQPSDAPVNR